MLGNALEEVGCHRTCKALQEKIPGVVWRVPYSGDYGYSGVLKSVGWILQLQDPSHSNEYV
jgi:hypothetical protein